MATSLSKGGLRKRTLRVLALTVALVSAALPAQAVNVGYYDMTLGAGNANQVPPITAVGHTATQLFDLQSSDLSGIDVLFVQNPSNGAYGAEYLSRLSSIAAAVSDGLILVVHDRYVTGAASILPGGSAFTAQRDLTAPGSNDINILDATSPVVSSVVDGVTRTLSSTSLDGGGFSSHGYVLASTLPATAKLILGRPHPVDTPSRVVTFAYAHGDGAVIYSTIPLDQFLAGSGPNPPRGNFTGIYAPNVVHYAALLSGGAPDLSVTISDGQSTAVPGEMVTYTVRAQNSGIGAAEGARVTTGLAAALDGITWSCVPGSGAVCSASGSGDIDDLVDLPVGGSVTYMVTGTVASAALGTLQSTAAVDSAPGQTDPVPANNMAADTDTLTPVADLRLQKTGPASAAPGGTVAYTLTVHNDGPSDATSAQLSDPTPSGLAFVSATSPCSGGFPCNLGTLAAGAQTAVTVTFSVPEPYFGPDPIVNLAAVRSATPDPAAANNTARSSTPAGGTPSADLRLFLSAPPSAAKASTVTFIARVVNQGPHDAAGVTLSYTPPAGLLPPSPCCSFGSLAAGEEKTVRLTFGIPGGYAGANPIVFSASVSGSTADPVPGNNAASASVPLGADTADLTLTKTGPAVAAPGTDVTWTLGVTNHGPAAAASTLLNDLTPDGLTFVTADAPCAAGFPCSLGTLASGQSATVRATFHIPSGYSGAEPIQNTASVSSATPEGFPADNTATALTGTGGEAADLAVTLIGPATAPAGTELTHTFLVVNRGPGIARDAFVEVTNPGGLTLVRATSPCAGGFPCGLGDLPPGASLVLGATWRIASSHVSPNPLSETVTAGSDSVDPVPANDSATALTEVIYLSDLGVTKTDGLTQIAAGMAVTYTIGVTNLGPSDVAGATVTDLFPAGLTGVSWSCTASAGASCAASGSGNITDTVNLARGASLTYTAQATVAAGASGSLANTASAAVPAGVGDPAAGNNSATDTDSVLLPVDLVMEKTGPATVIAGTNLIYTLRVTNNGTGTATSVVLADPTPAGLTFVAAGSPCAAGFPCSLPDLGPGQSAQLTATFAVPPGYAGANPVSNTATVSTAAPEGNPANNSATQTTLVVFSSDLSITKTDGRTTLVPGEPVTYTIVVANAGPSHAAGATVTDAPPASLLSPAWTCAGAGGAACPAAAGTGGIAQTVSLPVGGSLTWQLTATVDPGASTAVINQAAVATAAGASDPVSGNNLASDTDGLAPKADVSVTKTDGLTAAVPGEPVTWTIVAANAGPSHAPGVSVTDTPPAVLQSPAWTCSGTGGATCPAAAGTGAIAQTVSLPAGGGLTWQLTGTVDPAATGTLANTASAAVPPEITDPAAGNNSATDSEPLTRVADLRLTRSGPGTVARGAELVFTLTAANAGPSQASVEMTAPTPAGLTFVSATAPCAGGFPCALGDIPPGGETAVTVRYLVPADYAGSDPVVHAAALESDASDPTPGDTTSRSATAVGRPAQADLSLAKTAPSVSAAGSTVTYRLTVANHGPDDALGVSLAESIPDGLTFVSATAPCQTGFACSLGYLAAGESRTVEVTLAIPAGYSGPSLITNNAAVSAATGDPVSGNNAASALTTLIAAPIDLAVTKRGPAAVAAGQNVIYTLAVTNRGPAAATNAYLADPAPAGLTFVSATAPCAGGFPCFLDTVAAGQTVTIQATFHVPAGYAGANPVVNTASATANENDGVAGNNSATAVTGVGAPAADLEVTQSGPAQAFAGGLASYTLLVRNLGPGTATAVVLADPAPSGTTFVSATSPCADGFPCALGNLPPGSAVSVLATFRLQPGLAQGTVVTNTASLTATSVDPAAGNNSAGASTAAQVQADLAITKTDGLAEIAPGRPLTYTITVSNLGPSDAPGTRVLDTLPAALTGASWICNASPGSSCAPGASGAGNIDRLVFVAAGGTVTYTVSGVVSPAATGTLANTASVQPAAGLPDPVAGNNSATDTDTLTPEANLAISKTDGSATAVPGRPVTYTITVQNLGPSDAPAVSVTDSFPADFSGVTWTCTASAGSACSAAGSGQILDTAQIRAGGTATYTATGLLSPAASQPVTNTATVAALPGVTDPAPANNSAGDTDTLAPEADLAVVKDDGAATATPGGQVTYTITVTNNGPSNAPGATVTDTFPAAVTAVSWTCSAAGGAQCGAAAGSGNLQQTVNLPAGGTVTYLATATLSPAATGLLVNTASAAAPAGVADPVPGNNSEGDSDTLAPRADLGITKTAEPAIAVPGEAVVYTLTVTNAGPSQASGITVTDLLPATLQSPAWTCTASPGSSCTASGTGNLQDTASLAAGGTLTYQITATLAKTATGTVSNSATVATAAGTSDPQTGNNTATVLHPVAQRAFDLYIMVPCRLLDTRLPNGPSGGPALGSGVPRTFQATGACGIPSTAKAIAVNVTVTQGTASGSLRIYPDGDPIPNTTVMNFIADQARANNAILPLGPTGGFQALATLFPGGSVHFVVDVTGYFD